MYFPASYAEATDNFQWAAEDVGAVYQEYVLNGFAGSNGEVLKTQVAARGTINNPRNIVFIIGGEHGCEGYLGAAVMTKIIGETSFRSIPPDTKIICVNALNPWGFANNMRVDQAAIDPNRNVVKDYRQDRPAPIGHKLIETLISPTGIVPNWRQAAAFALLLGRMAVDGGTRRLQADFTSGQNSDPYGRSYIGKRECWSVATLKQIIKDHVSDANAARSIEKIIVIDIHTGLGPGFGELEIMVGVSGDRQQAKAAQRIWGNGNWLLSEYSLDSGSINTTSSAPIVGDIANIWRFSGLEHCVIPATFEVSTYGILNYLFATYGTRLAHRLPPHSILNARRPWLADSYARHFNPPDEQWRKASVETVCDAVIKALRALDEQPIKGGKRAVPAKRHGAEIL